MDKHTLRGGLCLRNEVDHHLLTHPYFFCSWSEWVDLETCQSLITVINIDIKNEVIPPKFKGINT